MTYYQEPVYIYGYRDSAGRIRYVGITVTRERRDDQHKRRLAELRECSHFIIRTADYKNAGRLERQIVLSLKKKGQADFNKRIPFTCYSSEAYANPILWVDRGIVFASYAQAARHFKTTPQTIQERMKRPRDGLTLKLI